METSNESQPISPVFICTLYEYNHEYASGEETDKPLWEFLHERLVIARNEARARQLFLDTLYQEDAYLPAEADQLIELIDVTTTAMMEKHSVKPTDLDNAIVDQQGEDPSLTTATGDATPTASVTPMAELIKNHPIAQAVEALMAVNPDAKIENKVLGSLEPGRSGWGITILGPSVSLSSVLRIPGLELIELHTKRTGRFTRTHLVFLVGEAAPVDPEEEQHRAICQRMDVDALLILGVKRPGAHRPEQGQQTLIGLEHTGLTLGELLGLTQRMLRDTNQAFLAEGEQAPFPFVSETGQSGGHLFIKGARKIITLN